MKTKTQHIFECLSCGNELVLNKPDITWEEAVKILKRNDWRVEGAGFEDHQAICWDCDILEAKS